MAVEEVVPVARAARPIEWQSTRSTGDAGGLPRGAPAMGTEVPR